MATYSGATQAQIEATRADDVALAIDAALVDLKPELRACIEKADKIVPNLQYTVQADIFGKAVAGSYVTHVSFERIEGSKEVATSAEACVADLLTSLQLPPSPGRSGMMTILRYDDCTPKEYIAKGNVQKYAREGYAVWVATHPEKQCPDRIEDLVRGVPGGAIKDPWGRDYRLVCGKESEHSVGVMSTGRDGVVGTSDDIESWNTLGITRGERTR